jgi:hypothetical protein
VFSTFEQFNEDSDDEDEDVDKAAAQPESVEVPYQLPPYTYLYILPFGTGKIQESQFLNFLMGG